MDLFVNLCEVSLVPSIVWFVAGGLILFFLLQKAYIENGNCYRTLSIRYWDDFLLSIDYIGDDRWKRLHSQRRFFIKCVFLGPIYASVGTVAFVSYYVSKFVCNKILVGIIWEKIIVPIADESYNKLVDSE